MSGFAGLDPVVAVALAYAIGLARLWSRVGVGRLVTRARAALFAAGLIATVVALGPPLDAHVSSDLTLHMTQHVILMWVAAPLLVVGAPFPTLLWALPDRSRLRAQRWWQRAHHTVSGDAWPAFVALAVFAQAVVLAVWHLPSMYDAAVNHAAVHAAEHVAFFSTAAFFWWAVAAAVRRTRFGAGVLAVFLAKFPGLFLGVGMTLSTRPWYRHYASVRDQQGAGVVMWVVGGMIATVAGLLLFWHWMQALERTAPSDPAPTRIEGLRA